MSAKSSMNVIGSHTGNFMISNQGAVDGCVGGPNPNLSTERNEMIQSGGRLSYGFDLNSTTGVGVRGGIPNVKPQPGCGAVNPLNMGASSQAKPLQQSGGNPHNNYEGTSTYGYKGVLPEHAGSFRGSYAPVTAGTRPICATPMSGGHKVCKDFRKVRNFTDVESFWSAICPGAVSVYKKHVSKKEKTHPKMVLELVKAYTKAFCHEEKALKSTNKKHVRIHLKHLKSSMKHVERLMKKMNLSGLRMHHRVEGMHIGRIENHLMKLKSRSTHKKQRKHSKSRSGTRKRSHTNKRTVKKSKTRSRKHKTHSSKRKTMRGGYHQFMSNSQNTLTLSTPGAPAVHGGANANPVTHKGVNTCTGIYNHYTGTSMKASVTDASV